MAGSSYKGAGDDHSLLRGFHTPKDCFHTQISNFCSRSTDIEIAEKKCPQMQAGAQAPGSVG